MTEPQDTGKYQIDNDGPVQGQVIGDHATVHQHFYGSQDTAPSPTKLEPVWMVPRRNGFFTGRETLLTALHDSFIKGRAAVLTQGQAINGLGGIGKTQIAMEYAYRYQDEYRFVLWANAATHETLISAFVSIADELKLPERALQEHEKIVAAVRRWLSTNEGWLLIVDNADELAIVWPLLPAGNKGHVLVTTRDQATEDLESFLVGKMDRVEGTLLLLRRAKILKSGMKPEQVPLEDRQVAEQIVAEMDGLPLALDQAGAYIKKAQCSLSDYLSLYRTRRAEMLRRYGPLEDNDSHKPVVATTWSLSFQRAKEKCPTSADFLRFCAFLAPDAIPEEIITAGTEHLGPVLQAVANDPLELHKAIAALGAYSLIRCDPANKTLSIHRLVQAVLRDAMSDDETKLWAERTVLAVNEACPAVKFEMWMQWERYLPHAQACADLIEQEDLKLTEAALLLNKTGCYLDDRARYSEAEPLYQQALSIREQQLGPDHPNTATTLNNLAVLYRSQGKYEQAEPLYVRALRIREEQLGPAHPDIAQSLNNLASLYKSQGKYEQAEPLYIRALCICEEQLGASHPYTATSLNNLAELYRNQGKYSEAEPLYRRALAILLQSLGSQHPNTRRGRRNYAALLRAMNRNEEAKQIEEQQ
jgi:tetratricopeptide (TPR) repeat protein